MERFLYEEKNSNPQNKDYHKTIRIIVFDKTVERVGRSKDHNLLLDYIRLSLLGICQTNIHLSHQHIWPQKRVYDHTHTFTLTHTYMHKRTLIFPYRHREKHIVSKATVKSTKEYWLKERGTLVWRLSKTNCKV